MDESLGSEFNTINFNFIVPKSGSFVRRQQDVRVLYQFIFHCVVHNFSFKQFDKYTFLYVQSKHFFV